ncbi:phosphoribosylanthranilate isomerase [Candidatus Vidania fulgoroideorum]
MKSLKNFKFCGIQSINDVLKCHILGVKNIGFILYEKSKRFINLNKIINYIANNRNIFFKFLIFGVFVNSNINFVFYCKKRLKINIIQFHGNENLYEYKFLIKNFLKIFFFGNNNFYNFYNLFYINKIPITYYFIDFLNKFYGGTGKIINFNFLINNKLLFFFSGGINLKNCVSLKNKINPYCIDISSGIEVNNIKNFFIMKKIIYAYEKL